MHAAIMSNFDPLDENYYLTNLYFYTPTASNLHANNPNYFFTDFKALGKAMIDSANEIKDDHRSRNIPNMVKLLQLPACDNSYPSKGQTALLLVAFASMNNSSDFQKILLEKLLKDDTQLRSETFNLEQLSDDYLSNDLGIFKNTRPDHIEWSKEDATYKTSLMASLILLHDLCKCKVIKNLRNQSNIDTITINLICTSDSNSELSHNPHYKSLLSVFCAWKHFTERYHSTQKMPKDIRNKIAYLALSSPLIEKIMGAVKTK